jgi:hypothetical protein
VVHASVEGLRGEIAGERERLRSDDMVLASEYQALSEARDRPGATSTVAAISTQLERIQAQRIRIRVEWQQAMQRRLTDAQNQLRAIERTPRFHDDALEADLAQQITVCQNELASFSQNSNF